MTSRILDMRKQKELQPVYSLWKKYRPEQAPHAFKAKTRDAALKWQTATRRELARTLGLSAMKKTPLRPRRIEVVDKGDYWREKVLLHTAADVVMPVYLLIPKKIRRPAPTVLAFHGHGYGVKDIVGLWEDGSERDTPDGYHADFAVALCKAGFTVAAPEIACFGERLTDFSHLQTGLESPVPYTCTHAAMLAFHLGTSILGMRVFDGMRLVDYLETRGEFDTCRLGAMGISGGGMHTLFSTCLDPRIKACVVSGYFSTFRDSILGMAHCACNFVPGLGAFGEMSDFAGLVAPRPMLVESGLRDPIFPISAVRRGVARARRIYGLFDNTPAVRTDYFDGRHRINGVKAIPFLQQALGADGTETGL